MAFFRTRFNCDQLSLRCSNAIVLQSENTSDPCSIFSERHSVVISGPFQRGVSPLTLAMDVYLV